jgi:hypothetical protein
MWKLLEMEFVRSPKKVGPMAIHPFFMMGKDVCWSWRQPNKLTGVEEWLKQSNSSKSCVLFGVLGLFSLEPLESWVLPDHADHTKLVWSMADVYRSILDQQHASSKCKFVNFFEKKR